MNKAPLPSLSAAVKQAGLSAKKNMGQNFLLDLNLTRKIARLAVPLEDKTILEIGPGPGGLTRALFMEGARQIIAIEQDERCLPILNAVNEYFDNQLDIRHEDALQFDIETLRGTNFSIVANLPYNIASPLLAKWLAAASPAPYQSMVLMFQKEVAERIVAVPGTKKFGRLSVLSQWKTTPSVVLRLAPSHFTPPPKVDSAIVEFIPRPEPLVDVSYTQLQATTALLFGKRRKMLRQILKSSTGDRIKVLDKLEIDSTFRPEQLSVEQICQMAKYLKGNGS